MDRPGCSAGSFARGRRSSTRGGPSPNAAAGCSTRSSGSSASAPAPRASTTSRPGPRRSGAGEGPSARRRRAPSASTARSSGAPRAGCTGPGPRPRPSGADTWTARSAAGNGPRARRSMRKDGGCEGSRVTEELAFAGAVRQAEMLRAKEISSRELTKLYLDRIQRFDPKLNAFRIVYADSAPSDADAADRELASGGGSERPLLGIPIAIKDDWDERVKGDITTHGTAAFGNTPAEEDSELVARLRRAGAVLVGR